jgi:hypothetical protein
MRKGRSRRSEKYKFFSQAALEAAFDLKLVQLREIAACFLNSFCLCAQRDRSGGTFIPTQYVQAGPRL